MKISMGLLLAGMLFVFANSGFAQCSQREQGKPTVISLTLDAVRETVKIGAPILVKVVLTNNSNHDVSIWSENGEGEDQYLVDVHDQQGNLPKETEHGRKRNGHVNPYLLKPQDLAGSGGCLTLKPGKTITHQANVSALYAVDKPGKYEIQVQKPDPESTDVVSSNKVIVTVIP